MLTSDYYKEQIEKVTLKFLEDIDFYKEKYHTSLELEQLARLKNKSHKSVTHSIVDSHYDDLTKIQLPNEKW